MATTPRTQSLPGPALSSGTPRPDVPKAELLEQCWPETFVSESALTRCLARLRKAVQSTPTGLRVIAARHRQGYRFVAEVTVLFCDVVESTTLAGRLDPEDYRDVMRQYQAACTEVIQRYGGSCGAISG